MNRLVLPLTLLASLSSAQNQIANSDDLTIALERTTCFGTCPAYRLVIHGDGSVDYEGHKFVRVEGTRHGKVDRSEVAGLVEAFLDTKYFDLNDSYTSIRNPDGSESVVTDLPTTTTSIVLNGRRKQVVDYVGAPKKLEELENKIDKVANSKRWVAIDAATVEEQASHGWNVRSAEAQKLFQEAARRGDAETVKAFVKAGVDVNARSGLITPLQQGWGVEVVRILISAGADVNATSKEHFGPPLTFAAKRGDTESIRALLNSGANVNGRTPSGETPLMEAAESGIPEAVKALLQAGADVNARDNYEEDALKYAARALIRQEEEAKHPGPFDESLPDYADKYKTIREMLIAAGAAESKSSQQ